MAHRHRLVLALGVILTGLPLVSEAVQISPNPNTTGSTIEIIADPTAFNALNPFTNEGRIRIEATGTLTNQAGATLINSYTQVPLSGTIENSGTFTNDGTLTSVVAPGSQGQGALINLGVASNNGIISNNYLENHGTFTNSGQLILDPTERPSVSPLLSNLGTWNNSGTVENHYEIHNFGELVNTGTINTLSTGPSDASSGAVFANFGTLTNAGALNISLTGATGYAQFSNANLLTNQAGSTLTVTGTGDFTNSFGTVINQAGSVQTITQFGQLINYGTITHAGTMTNNGLIQNGVTNDPFGISHGGTFVNNGSILETGTYTQLAGETINNGILSQSGGVDIQAGRLSGLGTITTPTLTLGTGASLNPGTSPTLGTLTLNGDLQSSGNLNFRFGGLNAGEFDVLKVNGNASFTGGNLVLNFVNGFTAAAGNSWKFLYTSALAGWDSLLVRINGLAAGLGYQITSANGTQILTITGTPVSVPEPSSFLLLGVGLVGLIGFSRKLSQHINKG